MAGTLALFERLFRYDRWANAVIAETLEARPEGEGGRRAERLFAHIVAVEQLWFRRVSGESAPKMETWPSWDLAESLRHEKLIAEKWRQLVSRTSPADLSALISYRNTRGQPYETALLDILAQVIVHGQHHRAQIALLLRQAGVTPPATDYIAFTRI